MTQPAVPVADAQSSRSTERRSLLHLRTYLGAAFVLLVLAVFGRDLYALGRFALRHELHSHIVLIPAISAYLIYINKDRYPAISTSWLPGLLLVLIGGAIAIEAKFLLHDRVFSRSSYFSAIAFAVIVVIAGGGFLFLGARWMKAALFPVAFLVFAIPLPPPAVEFLENGSKLGSAESADLLLMLSGTPYLRQGLFFQLPGITMEVAQECSGIRSSWVLLITSILAAYLFLNSTWRRIALVALVIPLGLLRNGFRIMVLALLCTYVSPDMIDSTIHHRGGPLFFVISLVPLFGMLWYLRRGDARR